MKKISPPNRARKGFLARHRASVTVVGGAVAVALLTGGATVIGEQARSKQTAAEAPRASSVRDDSIERAEHKTLAELGPNPYDIGLDPRDAPTAEATAGARPERNNRGGPSPFGRGGALPADLDPGVRIRSAPGIVLIDTFQEQGEGMGTGMVLTSTGEILTNYHVVEGSEQVQVTVAETGTTHTADVVGRDSRYDVALLQLNDAHERGELKDTLHTVSVSEASVALGDTVYAVGNSGGQGYLTRLKGTVTGVNQSIDVSDVAFGSTARLRGLIQTDADVVPGYSGGPLLDAHGQVIGLTTAASAGPEVDGFATPVADALAVVDRIRAGEESESLRVGPKGALGVQVSSRGAERGAAVLGLSDNSPAGAAGIVEGDVITRIDGRDVDSGNMLADAIGRMEPGDRVTVTWTTAAGVERSAQITLTTSPVN